MLVYDSPAYWKRQTRAEALAEMRERNDRALERHRLPDQAAVGDHRRRSGRMMHSADIIRPLRRLAPQLWLQDGAPGNIAIYWPRRDGLHYLTYCPLGWLPEYSIIETDARNLPSGERRGWRTVLSRLIGAGMVNEKDAARAFRAPEDAAASERWRQNLYLARNGAKT